MRRPTCARIAVPSGVSASSGTARGVAARVTAKVEPSDPLTSDSLIEMNSLTDFTST